MRADIYIYEREGRLSIGYLSRGGLEVGDVAMRWAEDAIVKGGIAFYWF